MARLRALVVAVLLLAVLGCEDEPTPDIPDPTPSSSAPSPTETESSPTTSSTPEALTPEETVRAWVDAWNQALQDGDTTAVRGFERSRCETCEELIGARFEDVFRGRRPFETTGWTWLTANGDASAGRDRGRQCGWQYAAGATIKRRVRSRSTYEDERHIVRVLPART